MGNCYGNKKSSPETRSIYPATTVHFDEYGKPFNPNTRFANNRIRTTKYSVWSFLPLNLWEQLHRFANVYFIFILILNFMPGINAFAKEVAPIPIIITLSVIAVKDAYEDFRRHLSDQKVNRRMCQVFSVERSRYVDTRWEYILPGDFVRLHTNEMIPADILLLHSSNIAGICHIETSNLDGESNLKQREVADRGVTRQSFSPFDFTFPVEVEAPSPELYKFNGKIVRLDDIVPILKNNMILRGCVLRNTDYIEGMVIYAGCETKAALNNTGPRFKRSKLERRINMDVAWCVLILATICFTGAVGSGVWQDNLPGDDVLFVALDRNSTTSSPAFQGFLNFWRFIIIFQSIIPLPLYVSIEFIKMHQVWHMNQDLQLYDARVDRRVEVRTFDILEDLGQIEYVFCDKTGTLTENKMEFKRASINGVEYTTDDAHSFVKRRNSETSEETLVPQINHNFSSLGPIVARMTLLSSHSLAAGQHRQEGLTPMEQRCPTPRDIDRSKKSGLDHAFEEEFILAMSICNTVVVSATKNTATLFQAPTRRKGIRDIFRLSPRRRSPNRKLPKKPLIDALSTKHSLSLGSLFSRRQRPPKNGSTAVPRFDVHDEHDHNNEHIATEGMGNVNHEAQGSGPATGDTVVDGTSLSNSPYKVPEPTAVDAPAHHPPAEAGADPVHSTLSEAQALPPIVPGLMLDLPTPGALRREGKSMRKSASTTGRLRWHFPGSDLDESTEEPESGSYASLDSPSHQRLPTSGTETEPAPADLADIRQLSTRTLTVFAHDGSSYELPVSKDFVPDTGSCPLSDAVLLMSYESESPDETSLVKEACLQGCKLLQRGLDFILLWLPADGLVGLRVLHILPFDSVRKRMSILIRHPATNEAILYTKGADSAILDRVHCANEEDAKRLIITRMHVEEFSRAGLRTLVFAKRVIPEDELKRWSREYVVAEATASTSTHHLMNRLERKFTLLGATGIEDRLQPGVPETIEHLREAGMHIWVLTGDKQETAVNVAHAARLITDEHRLMFVNATSKIRTGYLINCHLHSVLCGHSLPKYEEISDVVSDDPDIESTSSSSSPVLSDTESERPYPPVTTHMNARHVCLCSPECRANPSPGQRRCGRRGQRRITRSVSETRHTYQRRRRRGPRVTKRHLTRTQPRSTASLKASKMALIIDGETLQFALEEDMKASFLRLARLCSSVLCCRSTPSQKAAVVKSVKDGLHVQTMAIGDGANDVNMIQVANVGVGISGEEGMQAVLASDFAISRFRFLERLVLVHGHQCYDKLAHTALYLFYKDAVYIFLLFWYQLFNGFSGSNAIDQLSQILFSITFTGLPPFLMGIWDNPVDADTLLANPLLYRSGIGCKAYRPWMFWVNILDALWQTLIIFFVPYLFYADSTMTIWRFGVLQMNILVICSLLHAALETRTWVFLHWLGLLISYFVFWMFFNMIYHSLAVTGIPPENPYRVIFVAMHDGPFWLLTLVTVFAALLPRLLFIALNNTLTPSLDTVACLLSKVYGRGKRLPLHPYFFGDSEGTAYPFDRYPSTGMQQSRFSDTSIPSSRTREHVHANDSATPSTNLEAACVETPVHFRTRVVQLLSVSGRLFRGAPSTSRIQPVTAPMSPVSLINLRQPSYLMADLRRRRRPTHVFDYSYDRSDQASALVRAPSNTNNFDDSIGLPSTHAIWPAADPNVRAHSLSIGRHPRGRSRPRLETARFFDHSLDPLPITCRSAQTTNSMNWMATPNPSSRSMEDLPPPYHLSEVSIPSASFSHQTPSEWPEEGTMD